MRRPYFVWWVDAHATTAGSYRQYRSYGARVESRSGYDAHGSTQTDLSCSGAYAYSLSVAGD